MLYNKIIFKRCFCYKPRYWYKNIAQIPEYFRQLHFLIKNGYDISALWCMDCWFNDRIKDMLIKFRKDHYGFPFAKLKDDVDPKDNDAQEKAWNEILDEMIYLLNEMNEETCSKNNPYYDEWSKANKEFREKYGLLGEKLQTPEEIQKYEAKGYKVWHTPSELPEYQEIMQNYFDTEKEIDQYREQCKNDFFKLFSKYYYFIWD